MTDTAAQTSLRRPDQGKRSAADANVRRRYRKERRFKLYGMMAVGSAVVMLAVLMVTIIGNGYSAFFQHEVGLTVNLDRERLELGPNPTEEELSQASYRLVVRDALKEEFPFVKGRRDLRTLYGIVSGGADLMVRDAVLADPSIIGQTQTIWVKTSDDIDTFLKGQMTDVREWQPEAGLKPSGTEGTVRLRAEGDGFAAILDDLKDRLDPGAVGAGGAPVKLDDKTPSYLIRINGGLVKAETLSVNEITGQALLPLQSETAAAPGTWKVAGYLTPEADRRVKDAEIAWITYLEQEGRAENRFNWAFFQTGDSREPELAGIWGAVVGSFFTLLVTLALSFPVGVLAAVYLEEFAPKNKWTDLIEVNINNLAAVPSIVFGLLGLAMFLNIFGLPRSAPLVGGMVLALMTLPTIIIASRAALKSVPPSIREAALGMGASKLQTMTHHVLPLAMPGILTGTIIGMAQALGETAPLLMIGMVAFIVDVPGGPLDAATVMPVQIYLWADSPERAFVAKTSAAIMVLLAFLILMNALAVFLRKRFERRW